MPNFHIRIVRWVLVVFLYSLNFVFDSDAVWIQLFSKSKTDVRQFWQVLSLNCMVLVK